MHQREVFLAQTLVDTCRMQRYSYCVATDHEEKNAKIILIRGCVVNDGYYPIII